MSKKKSKWLIAIGCIGGIFGVALLGGLIFAIGQLVRNPIYNSSNRPNNPSDSYYPDYSHSQEPRILTQQQVTTNFAEGGAWEGKTSLNPQDLMVFNQIDANAFDGITFDLDCIEIDAKDSFQFSSQFYWPHVKQIKITHKSPISKRDHFFEYNNIIFYSSRHLFSDHYIFEPLTLANTTSTIDNLNLAAMSNRILNLFGAGKLYLDIPDNFYNPDMFQKVNAITIDNTIRESMNISTIGDAAFYQCDKVNSVKIANNDTCLFGSHIETSAFKNSSIKELSIFNQYKTFVGDHAFENCYQLKNIVMDMSITKISSFAFATDKLIDTRNCLFINTPGSLDDFSYSYIGDYCFQGSYNSLTLVFAMFNNTWTGGNSMLGGIDVANPSNFKIYTSYTYEDMQVYGLEDRYNESNLHPLEELEHGSTTSRI